MSETIAEFEAADLTEAVQEATKQFISDAEDHDENVTGIISIAILVAKDITPGDDIMSKISIQLGTISKVPMSNDILEGILVLALACTREEIATAKTLN